ncbi:MAG: hypothetical protein ACRC0V_07550 [Fusobacteriaceae bacterium]
MNAELMNYHVSDIDCKIQINFKNIEIREDFYIKFLELLEKINKEDISNK